MQFQIRGAEGLIECRFLSSHHELLIKKQTPPTSDFPCELFRSVRAVHGEPRKLDGWVWNHCRHPCFCEANNAAVPCFSLVWNARPQFAEFVVQWLNVSQQNGWEWRSEGTASKSDKDSGSLSPLSAAFPQSWPCGPDKGLWCGVRKQSAGVQELKVRFALRDKGTNVQKRVSIVDSYTNNIQHVKQQNNK